MVDRVAFLVDNFINPLPGHKTEICKKGICPVTPNTLYIIREKMRAKPFLLF